MSDDKLNDEKIELINDSKSDKLKDGKVELINDSPSEPVKKIIKENKKTKAKTKAKPKAKKVKEVEILKTMQQRYVDMLTGKNFVVRSKGVKIYDSSSKVNISFDEKGMTIDNIHYTYSSVVVRIK